RLIAGVLVECLAAVAVFAFRGSPAAAGPPLLPRHLPVVRYAAELGHPRIFTVPASGGIPRVLRVPVAAAESPSWSGDGRWIAFVGGENPPGSSDIADKDAVYVSHANGSAMRKGTSGPALYSQGA